MEAIPGYLSLHQTADLMTLKWTPNQLMNGNIGELDYEKRCVTMVTLTVWICVNDFKSTLVCLYCLHSVYWDFAMTIRLEEIVYLHCHQQGEYINALTL